ncbi:MAG: HAD family hydrolase [Candidatus Omnitrophota bacterium]
MLKGIKLIIFDLDGTLVDAYDAIVKSFNYTMRKIGLPVLNYQTIKQAVGWGDKGLLCPFVPAEKLKAALKIYQAHHRKSLLRHTRLIAGALKTLKYLKQKGYWLAVASNRPRAFSEIVLKKLKLDGIFDYVLCGDELQKPKPHPDILISLIRRFAINKKQTLFVGDMTIDINTGKAAGVRTVAVLTGSSRRKALASLKPFKLMRSVRGLVKLL